MAVSQKLTVTEVAGSASVASNSSKVRILWESTQTGDSWNGYTKTAYYYITINGGTEKEYTVSYTLPKGTTNTILDTTITVTHKDDGSGSVKVRTYLDTGISAGVIEKSQSVTLTTIARASTIDSAGDVTLGNACSVKWTPKAAAYRYKLEFSLGTWKHTTGSIHPNRTSAYTYTGYPIPMEVANNVPKSTGTMTVKLYTYSDSGATTQVGSADSETFTVTVPDNEDTKPAMSEMGLIAVNGDLPAQFAGLYIQGKSKVRWDSGDATGQYKASIVSYSMRVGNVDYGKSKNYTSDYLSNYGPVRVTGYATDSRGYTGSTTQDITVIQYSKPKLIVEECGRCDKDANLIDSGTYLKIKAARIYSIVSAGEVQKNFCKIQYRYKAVDADNYSDWIPILAGSDLTSDQVETDALLGGVLAVDTSYLVEIQAIDDVGERSDTATISIATDKVYMHRAKNAMGLGKYAEGANLLDVAWDAHFHGEVRIGDYQVADYVVEEGTSGIWRYRKWASGIAECWGRSDSVTKSIATEWGTLFTHDNAIPSYEYPFTFASMPVLSITPVKAGSPNFWTFVGASASESQTPTVSLIRPTAMEVTAAVNYYAIGRWK